MSESDQVEKQKKSKTSVSVRLPTELYERLEHLKDVYFHVEMENAKFLIEAVRLYVTMGEERGIDRKSYKINEKPQLRPVQKHDDAPSKKHPAHRPKSA